MRKHDDGAYAPFADRRVLKKLLMGETPKTALFRKGMLTFAPSLKGGVTVTPDHPVEHLWQCLREDVTYHICYDSKQELIDAVADFQSQINTNHVAKARSPIFEQQP